jgi:hypothetical protein
MQRPRQTLLFALGFIFLTVPLLTFAQNPLQFVPVTPCRVVDTRITGNPIIGGTQQDFAIQGNQGGCVGIPQSAAAYAFNVTAIPHEPLGYLTVWPTGEPQPTVSTLNSVDGRVKANAAIVGAGRGGEVSVYASDTTDVVLDIDGYFTPATGSTLAFYPLAPCRVLDTRNGQLLTGGQWPLESGAGGSGECDGSAISSVGISDAVAERSAATGGLDPQCGRWNRHLKYGGGAYDQRVHRRLRI